MHRPVHHCVFLFTALFVSNFSWGQTNPDLNALDQYLAQAKVDWKVPGFAIAIVKDDQIVFSKGYGVKEKDGSEQVDENTLFAIASNTKAFTAAAIAKLVDDGSLRWDDPVRKYLPSFELYDTYISADMTIRDLLCHRSGLGTFSGDLLWYGTAFSPRQVLEKARHLPQAGKFGRSYGYSNLMYLAAGEVITSVTGVNWSFFVQREILDPLNMENTITSTQSLEGHPNAATPHKTTRHTVTPLPWVNWDTMAAAGGLISSTSDMTRWIRLQLNQGKMMDGTVLFSENANREMWKPQTLINVSAAYQEKYPSTHFRAYGLGWSMRDFKGHKLLEHGGGYDGMFSRVVLVPEARLGMVVLTNSMTSLPSVACNRVLDEYLGGSKPDWSSILLKEFHEDREKFEAKIESAMKPRLQGTQPSLPLDKFTGEYRDVMYGLAIVSVENDQLSLRFEVAPDLVASLSHMHQDTFAIKWRNEHAWFGGGNIQFLTNAKAEITGFRLDIPNDDFWWDEFEFKRVKP